MRMPPGWDGLETIEKLWAVDPDVQVVICSAHSDYDWTELVTRVGHAAPTRCKPASSFSLAKKRSAAIPMKNGEASAAVAVAVAP
jgi:DNA-binding NarL/FixJ family response regulator